MSTRFEREKFPYEKEALLVLRYLSKGAVPFLWTVLSVFFVRLALVEKVKGEERRYCF